jgi:hypothetical protein
VCAIQTGHSSSWQLAVACAVAFKDRCWSLLLAFIVMPLDGEKHARAEHENFEHDKDYREPIHHF